MDCVNNKESTHLKFFVSQSILLKCVQCFLVVEEFLHIYFIENLHKTSHKRLSPFLDSINVHVLLKLTQECCCWINVIL